MVIVADYGREMREADYGREGLSECESVVLSSLSQIMPNIWSNKTDRPGTVQEDKSLLLCLAHHFFTQKDMIV